MLAFAGYDGLVGARFLLLARVWGVAFVFAGVAAQVLGFAAWLAARVLGFAFAGPVARLAAVVEGAFEFLVAGLPAAHVGEPALLVFEPLLAAQADLLGQEGAFRAGLRRAVAVVADLGVAAAFGAFALPAACWWFCAAGEGRLDGRAAAAAGDFVKDGLPAGAAGALVAQLLASVVSTFQRSSADPSADMLGFEVVVCGSGCRA